jgi:predicted O-methyltransferase YrrM
MKQLFKALLPQKMVNAAVDIRDRRRLRAVPTRAFDAHRLREASFIPIPSCFSDPAIGAMWRVVQEEISSVFPVGDIVNGVNPGDRRALFYLVRALNCQNVLEVGTNIGASTLHIAHALKYAGADAMVTSVDILDVNNQQTAPWKDAGLAMSPTAYADRLGCHNHIAFKKAPALTFMETTEMRFDLIFLDGDHSPCAVYSEVAVALRLLKEGGVILLHDYYPAGRPLFSDGTVIFGPSYAMERVIRENPSIRVHPLGALPWKTKLGSNVTSLALVTGL